MKGKMDNVSCRKGNKYVLKNINWQINSGEAWAVLGDNGSGKTTLLSILAGYNHYTHGEVYLHQERLTEENAVELRRAAGFCSSSYFSRCFKTENGLNIVLGGVSGQLCENSLVKDDDILRAKRLLKALGIGEKGLYPLDLLSKGQQQKVLLARALVAQSDFLLFDEALGGLDVVSKEVVLDTLEDFCANKNNALVYVTHHFDEIREFFTHVLLLKKGKIFAQGETAEILTAEVLSQEYEGAGEITKGKKGYSLEITAKGAIAQELWQRGEKNG